MAVCTRLINIHFVPEFHFFIWVVWLGELYLHFDSGGGGGLYKRTNTTNTSFMSIDYYLTFFFSLFMHAPSLCPYQYQPNHFVRLAPASRKNTRMRIKWFFVSFLQFTDWQIWNIWRWSKSNVESGKKMRQANTAYVRVVTSDWFLWHSRVHLCFIHRWLSIATICIYMYWCRNVFKWFTNSVQWWVALAS